MRKIIVPLNYFQGGFFMQKKNDGKKVRKIVFCISPNYLIKESLWEHVFKQIVDSVAKYGAIETGGEQKKGKTKRVYFLLLRDPSREKKILELIKKFNFEIIL